MEHSPTVAQIVPALLEWYGRAARDLPWRHTRDPYAIWVSEIMLQQTRVEAVKPYYHRFLERLPTLQDLAACPEEELLKLWEGLGYYSRVRNMQKAARTVVENFGGQMPATPKELKTLPGIGDYTAGSVASIAFGYPSACVDGNVLRVFARLRADETDISLPRVKQALGEEISREMPADPGAFNQSLMELGATVCLPGGQPLCGQCPVAHLCRAHAQGRETDLPAKAAKAAPKQVPLTVLVLTSPEGSIALRKRTAGVLKGMWELPNLPREEAADPLQAAEKLGVKAENPRSLGRAKHIFTHLRWEMEGWQLDCAGPLPEGWVWATPEQLKEDYALPTAFRAYKIWE